MNIIDDLIDKAVCRIDRMPKAMVERLVSYCPCHTEHPELILERMRMALSSRQFFALTYDDKEAIAAAAYDVLEPDRLDDPEWAGMVGVCGVILLLLPGSREAEDRVIERAVAILLKQ